VYPAGGAESKRVGQFALGTMLQKSNIARKIGDIVAA
jgi:hypothetical protein